MSQNANYNYQPNFVVQPANSGQVGSVVKCVAADQGKTKITTVSGGHSYSASSFSGNVILDLSRMTDLTIDDGAKKVTVDAGMTLGPMAKAIGAKGYALPHGTCPTVGVGGHSLGGGWGYASRSWGWLLDRITSMEYVDAKGNVQTINQASTGLNGDIWWAMRGAGANNFGVVTRFTYLMEKAPSATTNFNSVYRSNADCVQLLLALQDLGSKDAASGGFPKALGGEALLYGENSGATGACSFSGQYLGTKNAFKGVKKLLNDNLKSRGVTAQSASATEFANWTDALTDIMGDLLQPKMYEQYYAQSVVDDGSPRYTQATAKAIVDAVQAAVGVGGTGNSISFDLNGIGSATNARPLYGDMSFVHRKSLFFSQIYSYGYPNSSQQKSQKAILNKLNAITQSVRNAKKSATFLSYQNYIDPNLQNFGPQYYGDALGRLKSIKSRVDPNTIFDYSQGLAHA